MSGALVWILPAVALATLGAYVDVKNRAPFLAVVCGWAHIAILLVSAVLGNLAFVLILAKQRWKARRCA